MTTMSRLGPPLGMACVLALGACSDLGPLSGRTDVDGTNPGTSQGRPAYYGYGVVQSIDPVEQDYDGVAGTGFGLGTIAGAVVGGVAGNQVGAGKGKTAATVVGTAGGAYIGHQLEKRNAKPSSYAITVRMQNGFSQTLTQPTTADLNVGDRVRIDNGVIQRY